MALIIVFTNIIVIEEKLIAEFFNDLDKLNNLNPKSKAQKRRK